MRALTLWQPWASLIVHGPKRIENRARAPWASLMGRIIGIHAGLRMGDTMPPEAASLPMPRGALVGFARIASVVTASDDPWFVGPIGICLDDVVAYPEPIPMRGRQGYWPVLDGLSRDARDDFDARAAMRQYDGAMARDVAEWWALHDIRKSLELLGQTGQRPAVETKNLASPNRAKNTKAK